MPWYELIPNDAFDEIIAMVFSEVYNWPYEKALEYYRREFLLRSCLDYGEIGVGVDTEGTVYSSARLAIMRTLERARILITN